MGRPKGEGKITTSITVSPEFFSLCKTHHISFSEAARVGISILLAERGVKDYDNDLNVMRRVRNLTELLEEKSEELETLKAKYEIQN